MQLDAVLGGRRKEVSHTAQTKQAGEQGVRGNAAQHTCHRSVGRSAAAEPRISSTRNRRVTANLGSEAHEHAREVRFLLKIKSDLFGADFDNDA